MMGYEISVYTVYYLYIYTVTRKSIGYTTSFVLTLVWVHSFYLIYLVSIISCTVFSCVLKEN